MFACVTIIVVCVWWMQSRVVLDDRGYDVAIALYRVCNQHSETGLEQLERTLVESTESLTLSQESNDAIRGVFATAKSGNWTDAQRQCRKLLEDQVTR
ncbi:hypothetical protein [Rubripirellula amarantea]|nr:hypothetical protein [Rubripirellula amarantea]